MCRRRTCEGSDSAAVNECGAAVTAIYVPGSASDRPHQAVHHEPAFVICVRAVAQAALGTAEQHKLRMRDFGDERAALQLTLLSQHLFSVLSGNALLAVSCFPCDPRGHRRI